MKLKTLGIVGAGLEVGVVVAYGGGEDGDDDMYTDRGGTTDRPVAGQPPMDDVLRDAKLREAAVPVEARPAIVADLGNVDITQAQQVPTESGGMLYRITYIQNGQVGEKMYDATGKRVLQPIGRPAETTDPVTAGERTPPTTRPGGQPPTTRPGGALPQ